MASESAVSSVGRLPAWCGLICRVEIMSVIFRITIEPTKTKPTTMANAFRCTKNKVVSPKNRPLPVVFAPLTAVWASRPVINMPTAPPTPWQGNTSRVSSSEVLVVFQCTIRLLTRLANVPMKRLEGIVTKPAAGVMATRPTTAPIQNPSAEGFLPLTESSNTQHKPAAAEAVLVVAKADAANGPAPNALPALKPNHPNQRRPVPSNTNGMLAGEIASLASDLFLR